MAKVESISVEVSISDLDCFKGLIESLAEWVKEIQDKAYLSDTERALLNAALELNKDQH